MTATAQKTITITGTELSKLSASMLTVANNTVASVVASADGTSAVVTLGTDLVPETNTKVTATVDGTAKDYTVKYTIAAVKVAIQAATFDDDLKGQSLSVLVDGVATTVDYLQTAGYTVSFNAWNASGTNVTGGLLTATGGIVVPQGAEADYTVQVTLAKGSVISTSEKTTIKIRNLDNNASAISSYQITDNNIGGGAVLTSSTLVTGETAFVNQVVVGYGDAAAELNAVSGTAGPFNVESSNSAVISVNSTTKTMSAVGLGSADITITVGAATKVVTLNVVGTQRAATTVTATSNPFNFVIGGTPAANALKVNVADQYGDPFVGATTISCTVPSSITGLIATPSAGTLANLTAALNTSATKAQVTLALTSGTAKSGETGVMVFRNSKNEVVGSVNLGTTTQNVEASKKLVRTAGSTDTTLNDELTSDKFITYKVSSYASDNSYLGDIASLATYTVTYNADIVTLTTDGVLGARSGETTTITSGTTLTFTAKKAGSTPVTVKDDAGKIVETVSLVVVKGQPYMTGITFPTTSTVNYIGTINHETAFSLDLTSGDPIVKGVTLSASSVYKVRMTVADATTGEILYLDANSDGAYTAGTDIKIGEITISVSNEGIANMTTTGAVKTGVLTAYGNKGLVTFTVKDTASGTTPVTVGTKSVSVNVAAQSGAAITGLTTTEFGPTVPTQTASTSETGTKTWTSSNTAVATITSGGVVTPKAAGTTTISYTSTNGKTASTTFTVTPAIAPAFTVVSVKSNNAVETLAKNTNTVTYSITLNEAATATINTASAANNVAAPVTTELGTASTGTKSIVFTVATGDNGAVTLKAGNYTLTDAVGNAATYTYSDLAALVTGTVTADTTAPTVLSADELSTTSVAITFSEALDPATVVVGNFTGTATPSAVSLSADKKTVTVTVGAMSATETVVVGVGVKDAAGNPLAAAKTLTRGTDF